MHRNILATAFILLLGLQNVFAQGKNQEKQLPEKERLKFERLYYDAGRSKVLQDYEQAIKLYEAASKTDPSQSAPYYELGALYLHFGEFEQAEEYSSKAVEMDPGNFYYRLAYSQVLKNSQQTEKAIREYEKMIKAFPNELSLYFDLAMLHIIRKDYDKAIETYDQLEAKIGVTEEISFKKQYLYLQKGDVDKAAAEIEKLIAHDPEKPQFYLLLAEVYYINGFEDKALKVYKRASEKFPDDPEINLSLAEYYRNSKQYGKAFEHLSLAFKSANIDVDRKVQTILLYFDVLNENPSYSDKVLEMGQIMLATHPDDARVLTINGDINLNMGKPAEARKYFMRAVEIDSGRYPIWNQLLILEADLGIFDTLEIHSIEAGELFPSQPLPFYFMGYAQSQQKKYDEATRSFQRGLDITVDNDLLKLQFYLSMAEAYHETGNHEMSDDAFESALSLDSNNTVALNNYSYYLSLRGDNLERAKVMSARSNSLEPNQSTYLDTYAWILYKMGNYSEARDWMEKALNHGGNKSGVILEHMGDIYFRLDNKSEALKYWEKAKQTGEASEFIDKKISEGILYE